MAIHLYNLFAQKGEKYEVKSISSEGFTQFNCEAQSPVFGLQSIECETVSGNDENRLESGQTS